MPYLKRLPLPVGLRSRGAGRGNRTHLILFVRQMFSPENEPRVVSAARFERTPLGSKPSALPGWAIRSRFRRKGSNLRCAGQSRGSCHWTTPEFLSLRAESNHHGRAYEARLSPRSAARESEATSFAKTAAFRHQLTVDCSPRRHSPRSRPRDLHPPSPAYQAGAALLGVDGKAGAATENRTRISSLACSNSTLEP
jgi:hypothetical protein